MQKKTEINGKEMTYSDEWTSEPQVLISMESVAGKPYSVSLTEAEARRVVALFDYCNNKKFLLTNKTLWKGELQPSGRFLLPVSTLRFWRSRHSV